MEISCRVYKPRRPRESPLYRLVEQHLEELLRVWPTRFVRQHGPLRPVVERVLREFLKCGLVEHGFARLWCSECRKSVLVAFSCRGRSFCPSCEKKKQLLWAEWLHENVLLGVAHRHVVLTIPRLLRPLFRRRRELLGELARAGAEAVKELVRHASGESDARPGIVVCVATAGDLLQWHPHLHLITSDGGRASDGSWHSVAKWDAERLMRLFRERLLKSLLDKHAISEELVKKLLAWRHPGFSAHVGEPISASDKQRLEDTAAYIVRNPLSLKKLVYLDGQQAVLYRSRMNPSLGRNYLQVARSDPEVTRRIATLLGSARLLVYIVPSTWSLPDLPLHSRDEIARRGGGHGTPDFDRKHYKVLFTQARLYSAEVFGAQIVEWAYGRIPLEIVEVDLGSRSVIGRSAPPAHVVWGDIPTPMF